jgi:hypothetical protein
MAQTKYAGSVALQQMVDETKSRLDLKVDKVTGKQLSTEDYTSAEKTKLAGVAEGAQANTLEGITVDNTDLTITDKKITLNKMALKDEVAETDLATALATKINGKADKSTTLQGYGITDAYTKTEVDGIVDDKADLASPAFTGTPTAPTAASGTNTTQIATTAFVKAACDDIAHDLAAALKFKGIVANLTELEAIVDPANGDVYQVTNPGTGKSNAEYAYAGSTTGWIELGTEIDLSGYATINSPAFTGTPTAPTPSASDDSTKIATTAYVQNELNDYVKSDDLVAITAAEVTAMWA